MRLFDLEVNPSATSPLTSQPTLPEKMAPFPIRLSLTGNARRERLMLPGHGTAVKTPLESAASIYEQRHTQTSLRLVQVPAELSDTGMHQEEVATVSWDCIQNY